MINENAFFAFKLFVALSQASLNVDPFRINFTYISSPRSMVNSRYRRSTVSPFLILNEMKREQ
ncbi:hypothetical protein BpHYR1_021200 [Brachionus plicatilis]|uniref:Uncharacterized protein n=1 Tax=Brachionus plicatilis TaxID=10195 RepID=A0A3M7TB26_BRAPC|nr:hypothetical protein BpHYR1_021200 [Brachionus plicatilis]